MSEESTQASARSEATRIYEEWLLASHAGAGTSFDGLLALHPDLVLELQRVRRIVEAIDDVLEQAGENPGFVTAPQALPEGVRRLGDFRIEGELGRGGMGIVFEAEQESLRRRVALKVLPAQLTLDGRALKRFRHEAEITARLHHPGIIDIHQIGEAEGVHFIAMELVRGSSLDRVIERMRGESFGAELRPEDPEVPSMHPLVDDAERTAFKMPPGMVPPARPLGAHATRKETSSAANKGYIETAVRLMAEVALALQHAHEAGVIHRDVKPSNILVRPDGTAVLTDFGLARQEGLPSVSSTGEFAGTPNYVSPEQAMARRVRVDHRADIFSLGATLYELLTLCKAFPGQNSHEVLGAILAKEPIPPQKVNPAVSPDLVTIVEKALEKDPDLRYGSARAFAEDLLAVVEHRPIQAKRTPLPVRLARWVRREPLKASLVALVAIGVPLAIWLMQALATIEELEDALRANPLDLAHVQFGIGDYESAQQGFEHCLERDPDSVEALAGLAMTHLVAGEPERALAALDASALGAAPSLQLVRIEVLRDLERGEEAEALRAALAQPKTSLEYYLHAAILLRDAEFVSQLDVDRGSFLREKAQASLPYLGAAIDLDPERPYYLFHLAWAAWLCDDQATAERANRMIVHDWAQLPEAWVFAGLAREVFDNEGALLAYRKALELDPQNVPARQRLAELTRSADPTEALRLFASLSAGRESDPEYFVDLGLLHLDAGQLAEAEVAINRALQLDSGLAKAYTALGTVFRARGDQATAIAQFERAVQLEPRSAEARGNLGFMLFEMRGEDPSLVPRAIEHLEEARRLDPELVTAAYQLGVIFADRGEFRLALEPFEQALELLEQGKLSSSDVHMADVLSALGRTRGRTGDLEGANQVLERAAKLDGNPNNLSALAEIQERTGRYAPSVTSLVQLSGLRPLAQEELQRLDRLLRRDQGLARMRELVSMASEDPFLLNAIAWAQIDPRGNPRLRNVEQSLSAAQAAVQRSGRKNHGFLDTLAHALYASGDSEGAIALCEEAMWLADEQGAPKQVLQQLDESMQLFLGEE